MAKHHYQGVRVRTPALRHMATHFKIVHVNICERLGHTGARIVPIPNNCKWINEYSYQWDDSIHIARDGIKFNMPPYMQRNSHGGGEAILWPPHSHRRIPTTGSLASLTQKWRPSQKSGDSFGNQLLSHSKTTQNPIYHAFQITRSDRHLDSSAVEAPPDQGHSDHVGQRSCWTPRCPVHPSDTEAIPWNYSGDAFRRDGRSAKTSPHKI